MIDSRTETAMGKAWREQLEASSRRRSTHIPDPKVPGLYWPAALHAKQES